MGASTAATHRIAFLGPSPPSRGSIAQFGAGLASRVPDRAEVLFLGYRRVYPRFVRAGRQGADPSADRGEVGVRSVLVPWLPWTWRQGAGALRGFDPQLLVAQWWSPIVGPCMRYLMRRARRHGAEVVVVVHNHKPHEPVPFWRALTRTTLSQADRLVALSGFVADRLGEMVPGVPVQVVGLPPYFDRSASNGADLWRQRLDGIDGPVILFFGNVRAYKGLTDLVAAMPRIRQRIPATLVVAGTFFEPLGRFRAQAETLGVADAVRFFPDYVPSEEVPGLFEIADLVALPYRSASQSGILPQAAAARKPVVATAVGALPETIGENGVLVAPRDPESLADGLVRALERPPPPPALADDPWRPWAEILR